MAPTEFAFEVLDCAGQSGYRQDAIAILKVRPMFTASPAEIVVAGLALGSVVAWLDSLTNPPRPDDETAWGRTPETLAAKPTLALPAPSVVLAPSIPSVQQDNVAAEKPAPLPTPVAAPKAAAMKSSSGNAAKSGAQKGRPRA
jgi:hypothetical protein